MADTVAQADLWGLDVDKVAKGFADEDLIFKKYVSVSTTSNREIRWYQKTSGFLTATSPATTTIVPGAQPSVIEQTATRQTSTPIKYMHESPWFAPEDIKNSDLDMKAINIRDIVRAVGYQVDAAIWNVMTENQSPTNINSVTSTAAWDAASGQDPVKDVMEMKRKIRENGYNPEGAELFLSSKDHESLVVWLISTKGSSIPGYSSERVKDGVVMGFLGCNVVVSENVTADYACLARSNQAVTWKQFGPMTATTITDEGIGTKIRAWEDGVALLTDPKAVSLLSNTQA